MLPSPSHFFVSVDLYQSVILHLVDFLNGMCIGLGYFSPRNKLCKLLCSSSVSPVCILSVVVIVVLIQVIVKVNVMVKLIVILMVVKVLVILVAIAIFVVIAIAIAK